MRCWVLGHQWLELEDNALKFCTLLGARWKTVLGAPDSGSVVHSSPPSCPFAAQHEPGGDSDRWKEPRAAGRSAGDADEAELRRME